MTKWLRLVALMVLSTMIASTDAPAQQNPAAPQHQIIDTDYKLYNATRANTINFNILAARDAIANCNEESYRNAKGRIFAVGYQADRASGGLASLVAVDPDHADADAIEDLFADLEEEWRREWEKACGQQNGSSDAFRWSSGASVFGGRISVPALGFLGLEGSGGSNRRLNIVQTDETDSVVGASIGAGLDTGLRIGRAKIHAAFSAYRWTANIEQEFDDIDPGGDDLLIPGPEGGASGFNLSGAGNLNIVTNGRFEGDYDGHGFKGKVSVKIPCRCGTVVAPFVGVRYGSLETDFRFSGSVPGFARDLEYRTDVDVRHVGPIFGGFVAGRFGGDLDWIGWGIGAAGSVDFNDAEGRDALSFTGFADSSQKLENDDTTLGYTVGGGVRFGARAPFSADVGVRYTWADNIPVIERDGTNPSKLEFEDGDSVAASLAIRLKF